jgi:hypothetical protein
LRPALASTFFSDSAPIDSSSTADEKREKSNEKTVVASECGADGAVIDGAAGLAGASANEAGFELDTASGVAATSAPIGASARPTLLGCVDL